MTKTSKIILLLLGSSLALLLFAFLALVIFGDRLPSESAIAKTFEHNHVGWTVEKVVGHGDDDQYSCDIFYRQSSSYEMLSARWSISTTLFSWEVRSEELGVASLPAKTKSK